MTTIHIPADNGRTGNTVKVQLNGKLTEIPVGKDVEATDEVIAILIAAGIPVSRATIPTGSILIPRKSYGPSVRVGINGRFQRLLTGVAFVASPEQIIALTNARIAYVGVNAGVSGADPNPPQIEVPSIPGVTPTPTPTPTPPPVPGANSLGSMRMNLTSVNNYEGHHPFLNRAKTLREFFTTGGGVRYTSLDARGYPLPQNGEIVQGAFGLETPDTLIQQFGSARVVIRWQGTGTVRLQNATLYGTPTANRCVMTSTETQNYSNFGITGNVTDIVVVPESQEALHLSGTTLFNPKFLDKCAYWDVLRFMDWNGTNYSTRTTFAQRSKFDYATWANYRGDYASGTGGFYGDVPLEVMIALCNETGKGMHFCLPFDVVPDTGTTFTEAGLYLNFIKNNLNPSLALWLEWGNEVWNNGFPSTYTAGVKGQAKTFSNGAPGSRRTWYGWRGAPLMAYAKTVFADQPDRLWTVGAIQQGTIGYADVDDFELGAKDAGYPNIGDVYDEIQGTFYLAGGFDRVNWYETSGGNETARSIAQGNAVVQLARDYAAGGTARINALNTFFDQITNGTLPAGFYAAGTNLVVLKAQLDAAATWAKCRGVAYTFYEGQLYHTVYSDFTTVNGFAADAQDKLLDFMVGYINDPRTPALFKTLAAYARSKGMYGFTAFADFGNIRNIFGPWASDISIYTSNTRGDMYRSEQTNPATPLAPLTATVPSSLTLETGVSASVALTISGGYPPYTVSVANLPAGMSLAKRKFKATGSPNTINTHSTVFTVTDRNNTVVTAPVNISVIAQRTWAEIKTVITSVNGGTANDMAIGEAYHYDGGGVKKTGTATGNTASPDGGNVNPASKLHDGSILNAGCWASYPDNPPYIWLDSFATPITYSGTGVRSRENTPQRCLGSFKVYGKATAGASANTDVSSANGWVLLADYTYPGGVNGWNFDNTSEKFFPKNV